MNKTMAAKEIIRAQYSRNGTWRIVKKSGVGAGGWKLFDKREFFNKELCNQHIANLIKKFPNKYMEG